MNTFVDDWRKGITQPSQIDDYIDQWHRSHSALPLSTYLGLSQEQYIRWLKTPDQLQQLLEEQNSQ